MIIKFSDVYVISEIIERKSTADFFWPNEVRKFKRQSLIDQNKREGWTCRFLNSGLLLDAKIIISKSDYKDWPASHITPNPSITKSDLSFHEMLEIHLPQAALQFTHLAQDAEAIRKKIYISSRFGENASQIMAAQYFADPKNKKRMNFVLMFEREITDSDQAILKSILLDLENFEEIQQG